MPKQNIARVVACALTAALAFSLPATALAEQDNGEQAAREQVAGAQDAPEQNEQEQAGGNETPAPKPETPDPEKPQRVGRNSRQNTAIKEQKAHPPKASSKKKTAAKRRWISTSKKNYYYRNKQKLKGLQKIGKRWYFFDDKGVQRTGWQQIGVEFRYFKLGEKRNGYMVKNKTVHGVKINKKGVAKLNTNSYEELQILVKANTLVNKLTNPRDNRQVKLEKIWNYLINKKKIRFRSYRQIVDYEEQHREYANEIFDKHKGDCISYATALGYLARSIGFTDVTLEADRWFHAWTCIDGMYYDAQLGYKDLSIGYYWCLDPATASIVGNRNFTSVQSYEILPADVRWTGKTIKLKASPSGDAGWNKAKTRYFLKSGVCATGLTVIKGKLCAFSNKGKYNKKRTKKLQKAIKRKDLQSLLDYVGEPNCTYYAPSCNMVAGMEGDDGILSYGRFTIFTFRAENGAEYLMGVE